MVNDQETGLSKRFESAPVGRRQQADPPAKQHLRAYPGPLQSWRTPTAYTVYIRVQDHPLTFTVTPAALPEILLGCALATPLSCAL